MRFRPLLSASLLLFTATIYTSTAAAQGMRAGIGRTGFVTTWLVLGPFPYTQPKKATELYGIDTDFLTAAGGETKVAPAAGTEVTYTPPPAATTPRCR